MQPYIFIYQFLTKALCIGLTFQELHPSFLKSADNSEKPIAFINIFTLGLN
jgi:hypothetical protein